MREGKGGESGQGARTSMSAVPCMVYSGFGGAIMVFLLGLATIAFFIASYSYRRVWLRRERRPPQVFALDLGKMLAAGIVSSLVNYTFTAKVSSAARDITVRAKPLEGIGWYGAICVMDVFVAVPLSLVMGRLVNHSCRVLEKKVRRPSPWWDTLHQNTVYGKYSDSHDASCDYRDSEPPVSLIWWYSQTVTWTCACVIGEVVSGLTVLYSFLLLRSVWNPVAWIAVGVSFWRIDCLVKQYVVVIFGRMVLSYLRLVMIDYFNKYAERTPLWSLPRRLSWSVGKAAATQP